MAKSTLAHAGEMKNIAIIGGGIAGLATAFYVRQHLGEGADCTLIESSHRLGGKIVSVHEDGFIVEGGPDSFLAQKTATVDLCRTLGLSDELICCNDIKTATYVWRGERLHPMPEGMMLMAPTMILPFLRSRLISWPGKMRMGMEVIVPRRVGDEDESLASFVRRRLGTEALDNIAAPLMAGIHAADPETLSLRSTFPIFPDMEKTHGSLLRAMIGKRRAQGIHPAAQQRAPMFITLRGGLQQLAKAIVARLPPQMFRLNCCVVRVLRHGDQFKLTLTDGTSLLADDIVFATPAYATADLIQEINPVLAGKLRMIRYVSAATVSLGFRRKDITHALNGFGFVVPHGPTRKITACSWSSVKFDHRAAEGSALIRVFVGGARAENLAEQDEAALVHLAREELRATMGISAVPVLAKAYRWSKGVPQYDVGHQERIAEIDRDVGLHPGLHLAGSAYHGAGIPDCIESGSRVALKIAR